MDLQEAFQDAQDRVQLLPKQPNHVLLNLYALYKQASLGDVQGSRPGMLDMRGRAKYDAWASRKGMTQEEAIEDYVSYAEELGA